MKGEQAGDAGSMDALIDKTIGPLADLSSGIVFASASIFGAQVPLIVIWLVAGSAFFTAYLGFINARGFLHGLRVVSGRYRDPDDTGEISPFQALATAVSGTVGIGNMAGVAVAISVGGPGATFWMIAAGLLGMSTKFAECVLGVRYRRLHADGSVSGGPMHYLELGLAAHGLRKSGRALGISYAIFMVGGSLGGSLFQSNQAAAIFLEVAPLDFAADNVWLCGLVFAGAVAMVIVGGLRSIANTASGLVPTMAAIYILLGLVVLASEAERLPAAFAAIVAGAFSPEGVSGGMLGVVMLGFRRAVFSNEAGLGSAAIAHSAARTLKPANEGFVGLLEPFIDTVVICTMTALVITATTPDLAPGAVNGIELTVGAFSSVLPWAPPLLAAAALLFAFTTLIAWGYYGVKAFEYLAGKGRMRDLGFKLAYCACVVLGSSVALDAVVNLADALVFLLCIPNLVGLYLLAPAVKRELRMAWPPALTPHERRG